MSLRAAILRDRWYTLRSQVGDPAPARFLLHALTRAEKAHVEDECQSLGDGPDGTPELRLNMGSRRLALLRWGLRGWENVLDGDGKQRPFLPPDRAGRCADGNLDALTDGDAAELADEISRGCELSEDDRKN